MSLARRAQLEVADVFRGEAASFLPTAGRHLSLAQQRVFAAISACRTAALGGHVTACDHCTHQQISYNSCRNRHCPKCQALARAHWLERREAELLPIPYFHLVFTLPPEMAALALQNKRCLYGMLFEAASRTIQEVAANPRQSGRSRRRHPGRPPHVGPEPHAPSAPELRREWRRALGRRPAMGHRQVILLLAGPRAEPGVPS